jgi:hypothetical protein
VTTRAVVTQVAAILSVSAVGLGLVVSLLQPGSATAQPASPSAPLIFRDPTPVAPPDPPSTRADDGHPLQELLGHWMPTEGWSMASPNVIWTTRDAPGPSASAVASLATLLVVPLLLRRRPGGRALTLAGAAILLPWVFLDGLWQADLLQKQRAWQHGAPLRAGLHAADQGLVAAASSIRRHLDARDTRRVLLLHGSPGHRFQRQRLHYHLLPRNIYNHGDRLPADYTPRTGDAVILMGPTAMAGLDGDSCLARGDDTPIAAPVAVRDIARFDWGLIVHPLPDANERCTAESEVAGDG